MSTGVWVGTLASSRRVEMEYDSIQSFRTTDGTTQAITFSSIPQTYQHLQIRISARFTNAAQFQNLGLRMNSITGADYALAAMASDGSTVTGGGSAGSAQDHALIAHIPSASATANVFGAAVITIEDYTSTSNRKVFSSFGGYDASGSGWVFYRTAMVPSTNGQAAITSITVREILGWNMAAGTTISLYGTKSPVI